MLKWASRSLWTCVRDVLPLQALCFEIAKWVREEVQFANDMYTRVKSSATQSFLVDSATRLEVISTLNLVSEYINI